MQALFILGLFGIVFTTISVITTMLSSSAMQLKGERIAAVEQLFLDIETGINKGYLGNNVDFSGVGFIDATAAGVEERIDSSIVAGNPRLDSFIPEFVSWTGEEVLTDPWNTDYYIGTASYLQVIYSDNNNPSVGQNIITAPLTAFVLISAGPDKQFDDTPLTPFVGPTSYDAIKRYARPADVAAEDNIIYTFTTFSEMNKIWNTAREQHEKIINVVADSFKRKYELFAPTIQTEYYDVINILDMLAPVPGCATALMHAWKDPDCIVPDVNLAGERPGNLTHPNDYPDFPRFETTALVGREMQGADIETLGVDSAIDSLSPALVQGMRLEISDSATGVDDMLNFEMVPLVGNGWQIVYETQFDGSEIIGGL